MKELKSLIQHKIHNVWLGRGRGIIFPRYPQYRMLRKFIINKPCYYKYLIMIINLAYYRDTKQMLFVHKLWWRDLSPDSTVSGIIEQWKIENTKEEDIVEEVK